MIQGISVTKTHNWYVIPHWWNSKEKKFKYINKYQDKEQQEITDKSTGGF